MRRAPHFAQTGRVEEALPPAGAPMGHERQTRAHISCSVCPFVAPPRPADRSAIRGRRRRPYRRAGGHVLRRVTLSRTPSWRLLCPRSLRLLRGPSAASSQWSRGGGPSAPAPRYNTATTSSSPPSPVWPTEPPPTAPSTTAARAPSTRKIFESGWRRGQHWCDDRGLTARPADPSGICTSLIELVDNGLAVVCLGPTACAIGYMDRSNGLPDPVALETVRQVRAGLRRRAHGAAAPKRPCHAVPRVSASGLVSDASATICPQDQASDDGPALGFDLVGDGQ